MINAVLMTTGDTRPEGVAGDDVRKGSAHPARTGFRELVSTPPQPERAGETEAVAAAGSGDGAAGERAVAEPGPDARGTPATARVATVAGMTERSSDTASRGTLDVGLPTGEETYRDAIAPGDTEPPVSAAPDATGGETPRRDAAGGISDERTAHAPVVTPAEGAIGLSGEGEPSASEREDAAIRATTAADLRPRVQEAGAAPDRSGPGAGHAGEKRHMRATPAAILPSGRASAQADGIDEQQRPGTTPADDRSGSRMRPGEVQIATGVKPSGDGMTTASKLRETPAAVMGSPDDSAPNGPEEGRAGGGTMDARAGVGQRTIRLGLHDSRTGPDPVARAQASWTGVGIDDQDGSADGARATTGVVAVAFSHQSSSDENALYPASRGGPRARIEDVTSVYGRFTTVATPGTRIQSDPSAGTVHPMVSPPATVPPHPAFPAVDVTGDGSGGLFLPDADAGAGEPRLGAHGEPMSAVGTGAAGPGATSGPAGGTPSAALTHQVGQHLGDALRVDPGGGRLNVMLQPEDLGRMRLLFTPTETGLSVTVFADRPETLDLLRRSIDLLADDLAGQGFTDVTFEFGSDPQDDREGVETTGMSAAPLEVPNEDGEPPGIDRALSAPGRGAASLDLRL